MLGAFIGAALAAHQVWAALSPIAARVSGPHILVDVSMGRRPLFIGNADRIRAKPEVHTSFRWECVC